MLLDGYWKKDLKSIIKQLERWNKKHPILKDYAEHKINQGLLYSAIVIRKIIDDEKDVKPLFDKDGTTEMFLKTLQYNVHVRFYKYIDDNNIFINSKCFLADYDTKHSEKRTLNLDKVCNQLIHSYVWSIIYSNDRIYGALFASDKFKEEGIYLLTVKEWIEASRFVLENCKI